MTRLIRTAAAIAALLACTAGARALSPDDTPAVEAIVKNYLVQHPEVLHEALNALAAHERTAQADARRKVLAELGPSLAEAPDAVVVGNPKGATTLVEFFDYNCGYCKRALADLERMIAEDRGLRVVLRDMPVLSRDSEEAALVALAAHGQIDGPRYFEYHRRLLVGTHGRVGRQAALDLAVAMGADRTRLERDAADPKTASAVKASLDVARRLTLTGTPSYVVGDGVVVGAQGYATLARQVADVRRCGHADCP